MTSEECAKITREKEDKQKASQQKKKKVVNKENTMTKSKKKRNIETPIETEDTRSKTNYAF